MWPVQSYNITELFIIIYAALQFDLAILFLFYIYLWVLPLFSLMFLWDGVKLFETMFWKVQYSSFYHSYLHDFIRQKWE